MKWLFATAFWRKWKITTPPFAREELDYSIRLSACHDMIFAKNAKNKRVHCYK
jgi:hypothetical protein